MSRNIRTRLDRLERDHPDEPCLVTWDELLASGSVPEGCALDWDSLAHSKHPPLDPAAIVTPAELRLRELVAQRPAELARNHPEGDSP